MSKDITDTDEEFVKHCKQATYHLTEINKRVGEDDELTALEAISMSVMLLSVVLLRKKVSDDTEEVDKSDYKWDDDHEFK